MNLEKFLYALLHWSSAYPLPLEISFIVLETEMIFLISFTFLDMLISVN